MPSLYNHIASLDDLYHALGVEGMRRLIACLWVAAVGKVGRVTSVVCAALPRQVLSQA